MMSRKQDTKREILSKNRAGQDQTVSDQASDALLRRLMARYDRFSPVLARFFSKRFKAEASVSLDRVERTFFSSLPEREQVVSYPACILIQSVEMPFFLALSDEITSLLLDAALGDTCLEPDSLSEGLTALDCRLLERIYDRLAEGTARFWREEFILSPARILPISDWTGFDEDAVFFILSWTIQIQQYTFPFELYIPSVLMSVLSDPEKTTYDSPLRILAGRIPLTPEIAAQLVPGAVITTDIPAGTLFDAVCDGKTLFQVRPGEYRGEAAVEIIAPNS